MYFKCFMKKLFMASVLVGFAIGLTGCKEAEGENDYNISYHYTKYTPFKEGEKPSKENSEEIIDRFARDLIDNKVYFSYENNNLKLVNIPQEGIFIRYDATKNSTTYLFINDKATYRCDRLSKDGASTYASAYINNNGLSLTKRFKEIYTTNMYRGVELRKDVYDNPLSLSYTKNCYIRDYGINNSNTAGFFLNILIRPDSFNYNLFGVSDPFGMNDKDFSFKELDIKDDINEFNKIKGFTEASIDSLGANSDDINLLKELANLNSKKITDDLKEKINSSKITSENLICNGIEFTLTKNPATIYGRLEGYQLLNLNTALKFKFAQGKGLFFNIRQSFYIKDEFIKITKLENGLEHIDIDIKGNDCIYNVADKEIYGYPTSKELANSYANSVLEEDLFNGEIKISADYLKDYNKYINSNVSITNTSNRSINYKINQGKEKKLEITLLKQDGYFYLNKDVPLTITHIAGFPNISFVNSDKVYDDFDLCWKDADIIF